MSYVHIPSLPWEEQRSPGGKFHSFHRNISVALGGIRNGGTWCGGHPFDVQVRRIPPGEPHQLTTTGSKDLDVIIVADNPQFEAFHYPDSNKWGFRAPRKVFRATETDYWDGEE